MPRWRPRIADAEKQFKAAIQAEVVYALRMNGGAPLPREQVDLLNLYAQEAIELGEVPKDVGEAKKFAHELATKVFHEMSIGEIRSEYGTFREYYGQQYDANPQRGVRERAGAVGKEVVRRAENVGRAVVGADQRAATEPTAEGGRPARARAGVDPREKYIDKQIRNAATDILSAQGIRQTTAKYVFRLGSERFNYDTQTQPLDEHMQNPRNSLTNARRNTSYGQEARERVGDALQQRLSTEPVMTKQQVELASALSLMDPEITNNVALGASGQAVDDGVYNNRVNKIVDAVMAMPPEVVNKAHGDIFSLRQRFQPVSTNMQPTARANAMRRAFNFIGYTVGMPNLLAGAAGASTIIPVIGKVTSYIAPYLNMVPTDRLMGVAEQAAINDFRAGVADPQAQGGLGDRVKGGAANVVEGTRQNARAARYYPSNPNTLTNDLGVSTEGLHVSTKADATATNIFQEEITKGSSPRGRRGMQSRRGAANNAEQQPLTREAVILAADELNYRIQQGEFDAMNGRFGKVDETAVRRQVMEVVEKYRTMPPQEVLQNYREYYEPQYASQDALIKGTGELLNRTGVISDPGTYSSKSKVADKAAKTATAKQKAFFDLPHVEGLGPTPTNAVEPNPSAGVRPANDPRASERGGQEQNRTDDPPRSRVRDAGEAARRVVNSARGVVDETVTRARSAAASAWQRGGALYNEFMQGYRTAGTYDRVPAPANSNSFEVRTLSNGERVLFTAPGTPESVVNYLHQQTGGQGIIVDINGQKVLIFQNPSEATVRAVDAARQSYVNEAARQAGIAAPQVPLLADEPIIRQELGFTERPALPPAQKTGLQPVDLPKPASAPSLTDEMRRVAQQRIAEMGVVGQRVAISLEGITDVNQQIALRNAMRARFPNAEIMTTGNGSARFLVLEDANGRNSQTVRTELAATTSQALAQPAAPQAPAASVQIPPSPVSTDTVAAIQNAQNFPSGKVGETNRVFTNPNGFSADQLAELETSLKRAGVEVTRGTAGDRPVLILPEGMTHSEMMQKLQAASDAGKITAVNTNAAETRTNAVSRQTTQPPQSGGGEPRASAVVDRTSNTVERIPGNTVGTFQFTQNNVRPNAVDITVKQTGATPGAGRAAASVTSIESTNEFGLESIKNKLAERGIKSNLVQGANGAASVLQIEPGNLKLTPENITLMETAAVQGTGAPINIYEEVTKRTAGINQTVTTERVLINGTMADPGMGIMTGSAPAATNNGTTVGDTVPSPQGGGAATRMASDPKAGAATVVTDTNVDTPRPLKPTNQPGFTAPTPLSNETLGLLSKPGSFIVDNTNGGQALRIILPSDDIKGVQERLTKAGINSAPLEGAGPGQTTLQIQTQDTAAVSKALGVEIGAAEPTAAIPDNVVRQAQEAVRTPPAPPVLPTIDLSKYQIVQGENAALANLKLANGIPSIDPTLRAELKAEPGKVKAAFNKWQEANHKAGQNMGRSVMLYSAAEALERMLTDGLSPADIPHLSLMGAGATMEFMSTAKGKLLLGNWLETPQGMKYMSKVAPGFAEEISSMSKLAKAEAVLRKGGKALGAAAVGLTTACEIYHQATGDPNDPTVGKTDMEKFLRVADAAGVSAAELLTMANPVVFMTTELAIEIKAALFGGKHSMTYNLIQEGTGMLIDAAKVSSETGMDMQNSIVFSLMMKHYEAKWEAEARAKESERQKALALKAEEVGLVTRTEQRSANSSHMKVDNNLLETNINRATGYGNINVDPELLKNRPKALMERVVADYQKTFAAFAKMYDDNFEPKSGKVISALSAQERSEAAAAMQKLRGITNQSINFVVMNKETNEVYTPQDKNLVKGIDLNELFNHMRKDQGKVERLDGKKYTHRTLKLYYFDAECYTNGKPNEKASFDRVNRIVTVHLYDPVEPNQKRAAGGARAEVITTDGAAMDNTVQNVLALAPPSPDYQGPITSADMINLGDLGGLTAAMPVVPKPQDQQRGPSNA